MFRITSEARVVVHPRETLARAVISFDASTRAFASARLLVSPPGYDGASPSRPDEYLFAVAALASRAAFASIIARRHWVPDVRRQGTGLGTGLRDERHVHRVRLGRPLRRARARACALAPRAPRRVRAGSRRRARPRARLVGRDEHHGSLAADPRSPRKRGGAARLFAARASLRPRARRRRTRSVSLRDARTTRRARAVEARGRSARTSATFPARRPRRRRAPPAKARLCWRGALRLRRRRVIF